LSANKPFILYSEIYADDNPMECVYFYEGSCLVRPIAVTGMKNYKPNEEEQKNLCKTNVFEHCPRFKSYQDHLKAIGLKK